MQIRLNQSIYLFMQINNNNVILINSFITNIINLKNKKNLILLIGLILIFTFLNIIYAIAKDNKKTILLFVSTGFNNTFLSYIIY